MGLRSLGPKLFGRDSYQWVAGNLL